MSRSDQYIGLTRRGENLLKRLSRSPGAIVSTYEMCPSAFDPNPQLGWQVQLEDNKLFREEVQLAPWSSGPMYFTRLVKYEKGKRKKHYYSWKCVGELPNGREVNKRKGLCALVKLEEK